MGISVAVIGASGYTGTEVVRVLRRHTKADLKGASSQNFTGKPLSLHMGSNAPDMEYCSPDSEDIHSSDVIFTCMPHATSFDKILSLREKGKVVIDLSADFRFKDPRTYYLTYGITHPAMDLLKETVYGLPEINRDALKTADLIACPGCYPTVATLSLLPALKSDWIEHDIIINAVSGVSGAGRTAKDEYNHCMANENMFAYGAPKHRHTPEIEQNITGIVGDDVRVTFVPSIGPFNRGIYSTVFTKTKADHKQKEVEELYSEFYKDEPFVSVLKNFPKLKDLRETNFCHLRPVIDDRTGRLVVVGAIDNLLKGAGGQAVQCFNIRFGFDETEGLDSSYLA